MLIIVIISFLSPSIHFIKRVVHFLPSPSLLSPSSSFPLLLPSSSPVQLSGQWDCGTSPSSSSQVALLPAPHPLFPPTPPPPVQLCPSPQVAARSDVRHERRRVRSPLHRRPRQTATSVGRGGEEGTCTHVAGKKN